MSFSFSVRWLIETDAVTASPASLARRRSSSDSAQVTERRVIAPAGQRHEADVALEHDRLGGLRECRAGRAARRTRPRSSRRRRRDPGLRCGARSARRNRAHRSARGASPAHWSTLCGAVGEGDRAGGLEQADLGHLLAVEALGQRRHRMHAHDRGVAGAAQDEIDQSPDRRSPGRCRAGRRWW